MTNCVFDLETQGYETYKRFCNPLDSRHFIYSAAWVKGSSAEIVEFRKSISGLDKKKLVQDLLSDGVKILVGHNVKFDLLWLWGEDQLQRWLQNGGIIWDTQTVQYLLDGQTNERRSLGALGLRYSIEKKMDRVSKLYKKGYTTAELFAKYPKIMARYNKQDVKVTQALFKKQAYLVKKRGMKSLIKTYMEHYAAVIEMEWNGIYIDQKLGFKQADELSEKLRLLTISIQAQVSKFNIWPESVEYNPASGPMLKALLFGGFVKGKELREVVDDAGNPIVYGPTAKKAGQIKTVKKEVEYRIDGLGLSPIAFSTTTNAPIANETVLKALCEKNSNDRITQLLSNLLEYRELNKLLGTYYYKKVGKKETGLLSLVHEDGCVHTEFQTALTATGRLSSRNPNLQNLPPAALDMICSRFEKGILVEVDWSQLEVVLQAWLTNCPKFKQDVTDGVDFHCKRLSYIVNQPYKEVVKKCSIDAAWKLQRKQAKTVSFQKAYGAQPSSIARTTGLPVEDIEAIFRKEDEEYPEVAEYYERCSESIKHSSKPLSELLPIRLKNKEGEYQGITHRPGEFRHQGSLTTPTGKCYNFKDKGVITKRGQLFRYYSLPEIYDYPMQGTAADLMSLMVGQLYKKLISKRSDIKIINEVHDSVIFDVRDQETAELLVAEYLEEFKQVEKAFKERFDLEFDVPVNIEVSYGRSWGEAKRGDLNT